MFRFREQRSLVIMSHVSACSLHLQTREGGRHKQKHRHGGGGGERQTTFLGVFHKGSRKAGRQARRMEGDRPNEADQPTDPVQVSKTRATTILSALLSPSTSANRNVQISDTLLQNGRSFIMCTYKTNPRRPSAMKHRSRIELPKEEYMRRRTYE